MARSPSALLDPVTIPPVFDPNGATPANLPVPMPLAPAASGRALFSLADRLIDGMHEAGRGRGSYPGRSLLERVNATPIPWAIALVASAACGAATVFGWESPIPFMGGLVAGGVASMAAGDGLKRWVRSDRARAITVREAEPFLEAFKSGDAQVQALVRRLAGDAADMMGAHGLRGGALKTQLGEIAAVKVALPPEAARRITSIRDLAAAMPRRDRENVSCLALEAAFERLEPEDRRDLAPQLLSYLFRGERLRWKLVDADCAPRLHAALVGRKLLTSRDELQKLVAPAPAPTPLLPDSGGDV